MMQIFPNGRDQRRHTFKRAAPDALACDLGEPALDEVQPGATRRNEVQMAARMTGQPAVDGRTSMGTRIVEHQMQGQHRVGLRIEAFEKAHKLFGPLAGLTFAHISQSTAVARATNFCGVLPFAMTCSNCARSAGAASRHTRGRCVADRTRSPGQSTALYVLNSPYAGD